MGTETKIKVMAVAALTLLFEITVDRVLNVILGPSLSWFTITCCLFTFALASVLFVIFKPETSSLRRESYWLIFLALALVLFRPSINLLNLAWKQPWPVFLVNYSLLFLIVGSVFFFASLYLLEIFTRHRREFGTYYFYDLLGAALGIWIAYGLIGYLNPGQLLNLAGATALLVSVGEANMVKTARYGLGLLAALLLVLTAVVNASDFKFNNQVVKLFSTDARVEMSKWDPMAKIDVVNTGDGNRGLIYDDGQIVSTIYRFDGDFAKLRREIDWRKKTDFWSPDVLAAHWLKDRRKSKVFLIGVAGGQEVKAALLTGASQIDATEIIGTVIDIAHKYEWLTGHLFSRPEVHIFQTEGRAFLRSRQNRQYDIIQLFSAVNMSSLGTKSPFAEDLLLTEEAMAEYLRHLAPDGILQITHFGFQRQVTTLAKVWQKMGRTDLARHIVVIDNVKMKDRTPTLLIKTDNWSTDEIRKLKRLYDIPENAKIGKQYQFINDPLRPGETQLTPEYFTADPQWLSRLKYNLDPVTDDRPFFRSTFRLQWEQGVEMPAFNTRTLRAQVFISRYVFLFAFIILGLCLVLAGLGLFARKKYGLKFSDPLGGWYFSSLGFGFIVLEQNVIHHLLFLVGSPSLAFSTGVFSLLLSASIGSYFSQYLRKSWCLVYLLFACSIYVFLNGAVFAEIQAWPLPMALAAGCLFLFLLGLGLGFAFPLGAAIWIGDSDRTMAWAWFHNGLFTALGGYLGFLFALSYGFQAQAWLAVAAYAFSVGLAMWRLRTTFASNHRDLEPIYNRGGPRPKQSVHSGLPT